MNEALSDYLLSLEFGVMPYPGSIMEQPHTVVLFFRIIRAAHAQAQIEDAERVK